MGERRLSHRMGTDAWASSFQGEVRKLENEKEQLESELARMRPVFEAAMRWADAPAFDHGVSGNALVDAVREARGER